MEATLRLIVQNLPRAAVIVDKHYIPMEWNTHFSEGFGTPTGDIMLYLGKGQPIDALRYILIGPDPGWRGAEIPLPDDNGLHNPYWCEALSLGATRLLTMHDLRLLRKMETAYLHRIRRVEDDNVWILDDSGTLLFARTSEPELEKHIGNRIHELILREDWRIMDEGLKSAKKSPGELVEITVRSQLDQASRMVDICYISGSIYGGRYYAASRTSEPTGSRIVRRLKEAWQVRTDKELAERLGTSASSVSRVHKTEHTPADWIVKTGRETGVSFDWLFTGQGEKMRL